MDEATQKQLADLKKAYDSGVLPEDTYHNLVTNLAGAEYWAMISGRENTIVQAEGNAAVARDQGVAVGGDVENLTINQHVDPTQTDPAALRRRYLERLLLEHNQLVLSGIDPNAATEQQARLNLTKVYTALMTTNLKRIVPSEDLQKIEETQPYTALEQLNRFEDLVILGNPGSGKSTFVNFVTTCMAGSLLGHEQFNLELLCTPLPAADDEESTPQPWDHGPLLPVHIVLRDFAAQGLPEAGETATAEHLWTFIKEQLKRAALEEYAPLLKKELTEKGGLFLFDGLDEVPTAHEHRIHIKQVIEDVAKTFGNCRIVVTSRIYAYQKQDWKLTGFDDTTLANFNETQISQFIERWYELVAETRHLDLDVARGRAALLKNVVLNSPRLLDLARQPLLLTLMASLHAWRGGSLPEKREELYADAVDLLLDSWEKQRVIQRPDGSYAIIQPSLEQYLKVDRDVVRGLLDKLAYEAHLEQKETIGTADILESELVMGLFELSKQQEFNPAELVNYLSNRAGILVARGNGIYSFPHRTFQEYLAASHLTQDEFYPDHVAELARSDPNRWREVALLAGAKAARGTGAALWLLAQELCYEQPNSKLDDMWGAQLAGQLLAESADTARVGKARQRDLDRIKSWLVHILTGTTLPASERALAGVHVAQLGDPRPEVLDVDEMKFCYIPAGDFWMGDGQEDDCPEHLQHCLDYDYWMAQYPVTYAQYQQFIDDGGYADERLWPEAQEAGVWREGKIIASFQERSQTKSLEASTANQPLGGITWYETLAFTRWLTKRWQKKGFLPEGFTVRLTTEAQWEKAARGGVMIVKRPYIKSAKVLSSFSSLQTLKLIINPDPKRVYTWGDGTGGMTEFANFSETNISNPNSIGCFTDAQTVYGCVEMLGNIHEWCRSRYVDYPYDPHDGREKLHGSKYDARVVRGASYATIKERVRSSARGRLDPHRSLRSYGFRVCISPF